LAVRIRLTRVGATKRPSYRVVAIDRRRPRDGRALEILGFYDPLTEPATVRLETEKIKAWIGKGAQPSDMVSRLMRQAEAGTTTPEAPKKPVSRGRTTTTRKPKAKAASAPAAEASAESAAEESEPVPVETPEPAEAEAPAAESETPSAPDEATSAPGKSESPDA
jgi:small subunit ribosomal protein S16